MREKKKLSISRIVSNNLYIFRMVERAVPRFMLFSVLITALSALVGFLSNAFLLRFALNGIEEGKSFWEIAAFIILCLVINVAERFLSANFNHKIVPKKQNEAIRHIKQTVYDKAREVELGCYENPKFYDGFVKAIDESDMAFHRVMNNLMQSVYQIVTLVSNVGLLVVIDPVLLLFIALPLLVSPLRVLSNKYAHKRTVDTKEVNRRRDYSQRVFYLSDYAKELRLSEIPKLMLKRFREAAEENIKIMKKCGAIIAVLDYILMISTEVVAGLGATLYALFRTLGKHKTMGYGDAVAVINSIGQMSHILSDSANMFYRFQESALYIEDLRNFLSYESTIKSGSASLPESGDLVLNNVSFRYDGAADYTLKNLSMTFGRNQKIAIVGHNGAGKTTLVKLLMRLYDCEGSITYGGRDIKDLPLEGYREMFSAVMQDFHIFALPVDENVLLRPACEGDEVRVKAALERSGIAEKIAALPQGEKTVLTREFDVDGVMLSGGEQQKLAISHVYSKENRFVILDEPSSALDPIAEYEMYERMNEACRDCTMIFISHRLSSAVMADKIYLLENGEVLEEGTHAELMKKGGRYCEMFLRQAENYSEVGE